MTTTPAVPESTLPGVTRSNATARGATFLDLHVGDLVSTAFGLYEVIALSAPHGLRHFNAKVIVTLDAFDTDPGAERRAVVESTLSDLRMQRVNGYWPAGERAPAPLPERRTFY